MSSLPRAAVASEATALDFPSVFDARTADILTHRAGLAPVRRRGWLVRRALLSADLLGLTAAFLLAQLSVSGRAMAPDLVDERAETTFFLLSLPAWVLVAKLYRLYEHDEERTDHSTLDDVAGVFHVVTVGTWLLLAATWMTGIAEPDLLKLVAFWAFSIALVTGGRAIARALCRRSIAYVQNSVIVGAGDVGQLVARKLLAHPEYGIKVVGFIDDSPKPPRPGVEDIPLLGSPDELGEIIEHLGIERVIVAFSSESHEETLDLIRSLKDRGVQIDIVPRFFEIFGRNVGIHSVEGMPLVGLPPLRLSRSSRFVKRLLDLTLTSVGLVVIFPLLAVIAVVIKLDSPGPILFSQWRMGSGGRIFRIYKFRSMVLDAEARKASVAHLNKHARAGGDPRMFKVPGDPRITRVGRFLRRYSLDELPQLWNVLKGDMSLVGPRPLILDEDKHVGAWARKRLDLKPGITGPWQVLGRSGIPFEDMLRLDYLYVTSWSFANDLRLVFQTLPVLVRAADPY